MPSPIVEFLRAQAITNGYQLFDAIYGGIDLNQDRPITQSSGAVYGIWAQDRNLSAAGIESIPEHGEWFPIYWGKDISPISRMKAHVQGHQNGNINLPSIPELRGCPLIYGGILVSKYEVFEKYLHDNFKPFLGSSRRGRVSTIINIQN